MIIIDCPIKRGEAGYSFLETEVSIDDTKEKLWFKVGDKYMNEEMHILLRSCTMQWPMVMTLR